MAPDDTDPLLANDGTGLPTTEQDADPGEFPPPSDPTTDEAPQEQPYGATPEELDQDLRQDEEELQRQQDEQQQDEGQTQEDDEGILPQVVGGIQQIAAALSPSTPAAASEAVPQAPGATAQPAEAQAAEAQAAQGGASSEVPPLADKRLAELAATIKVTPEEVQQFKKQNPLFAGMDDARAEQALKEITAGALVSQQDQDLSTAEKGHRTVEDVEPAQTQPSSLFRRDYVLHPQTQLEAATSVAAGALKGVLETYDFFNETVMGNEPNPGEWRKGFENYYEHLSGPSAVGATMAQWGVGFVGAGKLARLAGLEKAAAGSKLGEAALTAGKSAWADFFDFDGHSGHLSDIIEQNDVFGDSLSNPVTAFLASKPDDSDAWGRAKMAFEGLGLGATADVLMSGISAIRAARAGDKIAAQSAAEEAIKRFDELNTADIELKSAASRDTVGASEMSSPGAANENAIEAPKPLSPSAYAEGAPDAAETQGAKATSEAVSESPAPQVEVPPPRAVPRLDDFKLQAVAKQIAGDVAENPLARFSADAAPEAPTPSTFDSLTEAGDLRQIVQATEDEILKGIQGSLSEANANVISKEESLRLAKDFALQTGVSPNVFFARMAEDAGSMQQLHARLLAYDQTTRSLATGIRDLAKAVREGNPGEFGSIDALHKAFETRLANYAQVQDWLKGARAETGRALNILKYSRQLGDQIPAVDGSAMSALRTGKSIQDLAEDVLLAGTDRANLAKVADPSTWERIRDAGVSLFIKNILSGPSTHARNIIGNTLAALSHPASKIVGGAVRANPELMAEGVKQYGYMLTESLNSIKLAGEAYKRGNAILDSQARKLAATPIEALDAERIGIDPKSISGRLFNAGAKLIDGVSARALEAADEFFKQNMYSSEVMARSFTDGVNLGLKGDELKLYVTQQRDAAFKNIPETGSRVANPEASANAKGALDTARYTTFTQDVPSSGIASYVLQGTNKWPLLKFAVPFVRVVNNILDFSASLTPGLQGLSRIYKDQIALGGREAATAQGRLALGSAMWTAAVGLAAGGYITGSGPSSYSKKQQLEQTGWKAHSLKVGDKYIPLDALDPIGFPFSMAGQFYELWQSGQHDEQSATDVASAMALAFYHNIADRSFLKGYADLFDALADKDGSNLSRFSENVAGSLLIPNFVRQTVTGNVDPYLREAKGFMENIMRRVPGLSDDLAIKRMPWGEKMTLNPSLYAQQKPDPVMQEYARLLETGDRSLPDPLPRMKPRQGDTSLDLAREELPDGQNAYDAYGDLVMQPDPSVPPLKDALAQLMQSSDYPKLIDGAGNLNGTKLKAWRTIIGRYRSAAWRQMLTKYPTLLDKMYAKKRDTAARSQAVQQSIEMENFINE